MRCVSMDAFEKKESSKNNNDKYSNYAAYTCNDWNKIRTRKKRREKSFEEEATFMKMSELSVLRTQEHLIQSLFGHFGLLIRREEANEERIKNNNKNSQQNKREWTKKSNKTNTNTLNCD